MPEMPYACSACAARYEWPPPKHCHFCGEFFVHSGNMRAQREKEEAIDRVSRHTDPRWATLAYLAVQRVAKERETFTATDLWLVIESRPHEPRALAGILRRAARNGLIEATDRFRKSETARNHNRDERIWRSLVHNGGK